MVKTFDENIIVQKSFICIHKGRLHSQNEYCPQRSR